MFFAPETTIEIVVAAATRADCGLANATSGALILYGPGVERFMRFAREFVQQTPADT